MDKRNETVKCKGPAGNDVYLPRATAESRANRVSGVRILEDELADVPDLGGPARKQTKAKESKPRKPRGPNKAKTEKESIPSANAN